MKLFARLALACSVTCASLACAAMLCITWEHNPQGEFHEAGVIHWQEWLPYGLVAACYGAIAGIVLGALIWFFATGLASPRGTRDRSAGGS